MRPTRKTTVEPLIAYFGKATSLNQQEMVGMLKVVCTVDKLTKKWFDRLCMEMFQFFNRVGVKDTMKDEISTVKHLLDWALQRHYACLKKSRVTAGTYCLCHGALTSFVMDPKDL